MGFGQIGPRHDPSGGYAGRMHPSLFVFVVTLGALLAGAVVLHAIPKLGPLGRRVSSSLCVAPWLDLPITYFTIAPLVFGPVWAAWGGFGAAVGAQVVAVVLWGWAHEAAHMESWRGPRIVKTLNRIHGRWRNHAAVWATGLVVPLFWFVRLAQIVVYPMLVVLVRFPRYRTGDWVNVSRQKFSGLVGHDLIWCLYCDWMTGVWSLGTEMLRNVESFWCPIKFASGKKCDNCKIDFPDIEGGWVPADATIADAARVVEEKFKDGQKGWFGHPVRLTVKGKEAGGEA